MKTTFVVLALLLLPVRLGLLIFGAEPKDKLKPGDALAKLSSLTDYDSEVLAALTSLGYSVVEAQAAIQAIPKDAPKEVEERLRIALGYFTG